MPDDSGGGDTMNNVNHQNANNRPKLPKIPTGIDAIALDTASSAVSSQPTSGSTTPTTFGNFKKSLQHPSSDTTSGFNSAYNSTLNSPANSESGEDEICDADCLNPYAPAKKYYHSRTGRNFPRHGRAMSIQDSEELGRLKNFALLDIGKHEGDKAANELKRNGPQYTSISRGRRFSAEGGFFNHHNRRFLIDVDKTINELLRQEDTNGDMQITIEDGGPKILYLGTASSEGFKKAGIRGTYMLSNLLQELTLAKEHGNKTIILDEARLNENPVDRLSRLISTEFWPALTRQIDETSISVAALDTKDRSEDPRPRVYVPYNDDLQFKYYSDVSDRMPELRLDVEKLPKDVTAKYLLSINNQPGLLSLCLRKLPDPNKPGKFIYRGLPFVVPGGRFNEQYGWDSYMESLGLIVNNRVDLAQNMVLNFCYEIRHYGKILNANRSYYLLRSQPPFLTDMALKVYEAIKSEDHALEFLRYAFSCAIKEYETVWMAEPRLDSVTGLSRYHPDGMGFPPETEPSHFDHLVEPYAEKYKISKEEFMQKYNKGEIHEKDLDIYLMHDRAVRESGHDTTCRFDNKCADLATIDLNSLLYKYETDIETVIRTKFDNHMVLSFDDPYEDNMREGEFLAEKLRVESSLKWNRAARRRKRLIDKYLWNTEKRMYFDFNTATHQQEDYVSATMFWALWAQCASPLQAANVVENALPLLEQYGGLASCSKDSVRKVSLDAPNRQWDYPFGWAPQQMLAWKGLSNYGYKQETQRIVYRWLFMMTKAFVDFNGIVVEKYNVTRLSDPHRVDAEYGNQGANFKGRAKEGFGWVNSSYVVGLTYLSTYARRALGTLTPPQAFFQAEESESD